MIFSPPEHSGTAGVVPAIVIDFLSPHYEIALKSNTVWFDMNKRKMLVSLAALLVPISLSAVKFEFTTVSDVVKKIKDRYAGIECLTTEFTMESDKGGRKTTRSGLIRTRYPNYLMVDFYSPAGQKIVSDGDTLWMYIPSMNIVAEQDLKDDEGGLFSSNSRTGLQRLFTRYHYKFAQKEQPSAGPDGKKYYSIFLQQKESRSGYRTIRIWVDENYYVTRAEGETSAGKKVRISFNKIQTDKEYPKGIFKLDKPASARVVKNPMLAEE